MNEDLKGEQFIRGVKPTSTERHSETSRLSAAANAKTTSKQKATVPDYGAMSCVMRGAMAEQRVLKRQPHEGA